MTFHRCILLGVILSVLTASGKLQAAPPTKSTVTVEVPKQFPAGITTVVVGQLSNKKVAGNAWLLKRIGHEPVAGQRDSQTGRVLFLAAITADEVGGKLEFQLAEPKFGWRVDIVETPTGFRFLDGKRAVMDYRREPKSLDGKSKRANYIHPLYGLDGEELTQDFPSDHLHHRGIFWAWHQLWVGEQRAGDAWVNKDLQYVVRKAEVVDRGLVFATLKLKVDWMSSVLTDDSGQPKAVVEETTLIRLFHSVDKTQLIDFEIRLKPLLPDVRIGGSEDVKGYSGFTVRVRPPREMKITDANGQLKKDTLQTASAWADVSGQFGDGNKTTGLAILGHSSLPQFPPKWVLRHYGMQNVAYPGREPIALNADKPLVLRHRLVIHSGDVQKSRISDHQRAYELQP